MPEGQKEPDSLPPIDTEDDDEMNAKLTPSRGDHAMTLIKLRR